MAEAELVRRTLAGRTEAYAELVRRWTPRVLAVCHARVGKADVAEDLAQETLLRGFRSLGSLSEPEKFGSWLCGIALRVCLDWLKAKERTTIPFSTLARGQPLDDVLNHHVHVPTREAEEDVDRLMREVESLPQIYRQVVMLYYYQDLTYRELAEMLGVSPAAVNARLTRARAMLRRRLQPQPS